MPGTASKATQAKADFERGWGGQVPIVIGAIGHRNIDTADAKLAAAIGRECRRLKSKYSSSPFIVLSALAEGADRLIARTAMDQLGAALIAVLPMPEADYERDFETEDSKGAFRAFLDEAACVRVAPLAEGDAWKSDGEPRNEQYARAGAIIVEHSQVLFAIWDGEEARGTGGTGDQVKWFERGYAPNKYSLYDGALSPLSPLEPGLRILADPATAKISQGDPSQPAAGKKDIPPKGHRSDMRQILERTNRYNRDVARNSEAIAQAAPVAEDAQEALKALSIAGNVYKAADYSSVSFASKVRWSDDAVYLLALVAVAAFNLISANRIAPWVYFAVTALMLTLTIRIRLFSIDNRFLEYRCLAEAMRTLFFWRSAGIARPVWLAYLARQAGVVHWIRHSVRTIEFCQDCRPSQLKANGLAVFPDLPFVKRAWVGGQGEWFSRKERQHVNSVNTWKLIERGAIAASFAVAMALALLTFLPGKWWDSYVEPKHYGDLWQLVLGLFAASGLAVRGFLSRRAHLELTKQYASQRQIFETAKRMLDDPKSDWKPEEILKRLGDEALQEQSEWVWLRHTKPFEVPMP